MKFAAFCCSAILMRRLMPARNYPRTSWYYCIYYSGSHLFKFILVRFLLDPLLCICLLADSTLKFPVFWSSQELILLRGTCASALPPSHHLSLTICLAALGSGETARECAELGMTTVSYVLSTKSKKLKPKSTKPMRLSTSAATARRNKHEDASCRRSGPSR